MTFSDVVNNEAVTNLMELFKRVADLERLPTIGGQGPLVGTGFRVATRAINSVDTATVADFALICDATGGAFAANLPTAVGIGGQVFFYKRINAAGGNVTVTASGAETIDGVGTYVLSAQYDAVLIISDGANWHILAIMP